MALPTFPVSDEPLTFTSTKIIIAIAANNLSIGNEMSSAIKPPVFNRCAKNAPNATAYKLPAIV